VHYWQHNALPRDDARLAAIAGLSVSQWRRIREPVQAKFADGWKHKRIEAELAKTDRAYMQRRLAGRSGGIKSGIARAVTKGEAIIRAEAAAKRALARGLSGHEAAGAAAGKPPRTNHNHRSISSSSSSCSAAEIPPNPPEQIDKGSAANQHADAPVKPAAQWSRQDLDALFARRTRAGGADSSDAPAKPERGN
jgi:Protein of unknown function (DUF1376)